MANTKKAYGIAAGADMIVGFRAPSELYDTLATALGLNTVEATEMGKFKQVPAANVGFQRVGIAYVLSAGPPKIMRNGKVWCALGNYEEVMKGSLNSLTYRGKAIDHVFQPMDTSRS